MSGRKNKQAYQIQGTYHSKIFRQTCILNCFHRRNHTGHALLPTLCHCHSPPPTCVLRKWVSLSVKYKVRESKQRLGCLRWGKTSPCISFGTNSLLLSKKAMFFCKSDIPDHHFSYCHQRLQSRSVEFLCLLL